MRVRITKPPKERDIDGVRLDCFQPGDVRDVSAPLAEWLIAEGYAVPEMRRSAADEIDFGRRIKTSRGADDRRPRRRSSDR